MFCFDLCVDLLFVFVRFVFCFVGLDTWVDYCDTWLVLIMFVF